MKKQRILGRRLARELKQTELETISGGAPTYTLTYPPDRDKIQPGGGGSID